MSQQQTKLEEERRTLEREIQELEKAMSPEEAAQKIVEVVTAKQDPLLLENEWVAASGGGCCAVQ